MTANKSGDKANDMNKSEPTEGAAKGPGKAPYPRPKGIEVQGRPHAVEGPKKEVEGPMEKAAEPMCIISTKSLQTVYDWLNSDRMTMPQAEVRVCLKLLMQAKNV